MPQINTQLQIPLPFQLQAERGEAKSSPGASSFMQAYEMAQRKNDPFEQLKRASLEQDMQARAFEIQKQFEDRQRMLNAETKAQAVAPAIRSLLEAERPNEAFLQLQVETAKDTDLTNAPTWNSLAKSVKMAADIYNNIDETKARLARDARGTPDMQNAARIAEAKLQLRKSEQMTGQVAEMTPELQVELDKQQALKDEIGVLEVKTKAVEPTVQVIEGKKFLVNPKTGRFEPLNKSVSKQQFIAQNVAKWMDEFAIQTEQEAATRLAKFYDDNIATIDGAAPVPVTTTPAPPRFKWIPGQGIVPVQ